MVMINSELGSGVSRFLESGDRSFLATMQSMDRNSIEAQAVIRYLMQIKHWPFTPDSEFAGLLDHFFAEFPERKKLNPQEYQATTFSLIKDTFGYECVVVVPEPRPEPEKKPAKKPTSKRSKPEMIPEEESEGASGSKTYKSLAGAVDTKGASERLKKTIAIQRGG